MKQKKHIKKSTPQFSFAERVKIEVYLKEGVSKREIARKLGREASSVRYEIRKNTVRKTYSAEKAHVKAYQRRWRAKTQVLKVAIMLPLKRYVEEKLRLYWSPEAIVGRIQYVDRDIPRVGKDAIYAYVESVHGRNLEQCLWWKGKKTRTHHPRVTLDGRTMIDKRPKHIEKRRYYGDWEGDFIVSGKTGSGALLVLVERKSRYVIIRKLSDRKVSTVNATLAEIFGGGQILINSLTLDNDISFQKHEALSKEIGAPIYFCHPYHSWEKGSVEKMNQLIRRFVPKGTNIAKVSEKRIREIEVILNNMPRACLMFRTPTEKMQENKKLKLFVERVCKKETKKLVLKD